MVKFSNFWQNNFEGINCCESLFLQNDGHWNKKNMEFILANAISKQTFTKFIVSNEGLFYIINFQYSSFRIELNCFWRNLWVVLHFKLPFWLGFQIHLGASILSTLLLNTIDDRYLKHLLSRTFTISNFLADPLNFSSNSRLKNIRYLELR